MTLSSGGVLCWGGSATNWAALSCFQGSQRTPNFKLPRTGLFNQIELVQGLPLWKFGAAHTVTEGLDMELPATGLINCLTVCLLVGWPVGAHKSYVQLQLGEASRLNRNTYKRKLKDLTT